MSDIEAQRELRYKKYDEDFSYYFSKSKRYKSLLLDDADRKAMFIKNEQKKRHSVFDYSDIVGVYKKVDETHTSNTKKKHAIRRGLLGGAIAGPAGAIVGAGSSKSNTTHSSKINSVSVSIQLNNGKSYVVDFGSSDRDIQKANELESVINGIINSNQSNTQSSNNSSNNLDNLTKLKELVDAGVLTEEEFTAKKKQILGI